MLRLFRQNADGRAVARVLHGDGEAFGVLMERYGRAALAVARAIAPAPSDADDILQEAFVLAYRKLDTLEQPHRFGPWLISITRNVALRVRERARDTTSLDGLPESVVSVASAPERTEIRAVVRQALEHLDAEPREVLFLHYFAGNSVAEIADMLAITPAAVKKRLQRARESLGNDLLRTLGKESEDVLDLSARRRKQLLATVLAAGAAWQGKAQAATATAATASAGAISLVLKLLLALFAIGGITTAALWPAFTSKPSTDTTPEARATSASDAANKSAKAVPDAPLPKPASSESFLADDTAATGPGSLETFLKGPDGAPVPNASAVLERVTWEPMQLPPAKVPTWHGTSDADGRVRFENLPLGEYSMLAYTEALGGGEDFVIGKNRPKSYEDATNLMPLQAMNGRVVNTAGEPVANAVLYPIGHEISPNDEFNLTQVAAVRTRSGADGRFSFSRVWPGKMKFMVCAEGYAPLRSDWTPTSGEPTFTLDTGASLELKLARDSDGGALRGIPMALHGKGSSWFGYKGVTDATGVLHLEHLAPTSYELAMKDAALVLADPADIEIAAGEAKFITIRATAGATILGRVTEATTGEPLPGLVVMSQAEPEREAITAEDGSYMLVGVPTGDILVGVCGVVGSRMRTHPGGPPGFEGGQETYRQVHVNLGDNLEGIDFQLRRALEVSGRVVDAAGNPVGKAQVQITLKGCKSLGQGTQSQDDGAFKFNGIESGCPATVFAHNETGVSPRVPLTPENVANVDLVLETKGVFLAGSAVGPDGKPIKAGQVSLNYPDGLCISSDIKSGRVSFGMVPAGDLAYGVMYMTEDQSGHPCRPVNLTLHEGERFKDFKFTCGGGGDLSIIGKVLLPDGKPATGALVTMMGFPQQAAADKQGKFQIDGLEDKDYTFIATLKGFSPIEGVSARGGDSDVVLQLAALGRVAGHVTDAKTGAPIKAHLQLTPYSMGMSDSLETSSAEDGAFSIDGVKIGGGQIVVEASHYAKRRAQYDTIDPGADTNIDIQLHAPAAIAGVVVAADGTPIENAQILEVESRDTRSTAADGTFQFEGLEESVQRTFEVTTTEHGVTTFEANPGAPGSDALKIEMGVPPTLQVNVSFNGEPLDEFELSAYQENSPKPNSLNESVKGSHGQWSSTKVAPGVWQVVVTRMEADHAMFRPVQSFSRQVELQAGQVTELTVDLLAGDANLSGVVTLANGTAPQRMFATLLATDGSGRMYNDNVADASYRIKGIAPGEYLLTLIVELRPTNHQVIRRVTLADGEEKSLDAHLSGGAAVTVARGDAGPGVIQVFLNTGSTPSSFSPSEDLSKVDDRETFFFSITPKDDAITLPEVAPGDYWLSCYPPFDPKNKPGESREPAVRRVTVVPGPNEFQAGG